MPLYVATEIVNAEFRIKSASSLAPTKFYSSSKKKELNPQMSSIKFLRFWISGSMKFRKPEKKLRICCSIGACQVLRKSLSTSFKRKITNNLQETTSIKLRLKLAVIFQSKQKKDSSYKSKEFKKTIKPKLTP